ncbi:MAG: tRNA pseudouridine(55) synthase TruB [Anaerolineales bacterium]|nr:tRNA pseudouridine(55) synthase TruB [Anaerolineales bacterium]
MVTKTDFPFLSGLLNIDKPKGITSHDVVNRVRRLVGQRRVGHAGTLDPMATGVLLVCLGQATRLIEYVVAGQKQYRATIRFGVTTDTLDAEGQVTAVNDLSSLDEAHLREILPAFLGEIEQIPPLFSAIKQAGQPLYKRARAGKVVEVAPRRVTIHALTWVAWQPPDLILDITCSAGTYIRALARDLGEAAGSGAHLAELTRTASGPWQLAEAVSLEQLEWEAAQNASAWQRHLHPPDKAITHLPKVILTEEAVKHVQQGRQLQIEAAPYLENAGPIRAYTPSGDFLAILTSVEPSAKLWQPKKVFQIKDK